MCPLFLAAALLAPPSPGGDTATEPLAAWDFGPADDRDFDRWPDGWLRRRGPGFPAFVPVQIERADDGAAALRFTANGGAAAAYSPPIALPRRQALRLAARIAAAGLETGAAVLSLSLLDRDQVRIARFLAEPVSGDGDRRAEIGPIPPTPGAAWAVVGCHLVPGEAPGLAGSAAFADLRLTAEPHLTIALAPPGPMAAVGDALTVRIDLGGATTGTPPAATLAIRDAADPGGAEVRAVPLTPGDGGVAGRTRFTPPEPGLWGFTATVRHAGRTLTRTATVAAAEIGNGGGTPNAAPSRFGWTLAAAPPADAGAVADDAAAAGAGWVRWPGGGAGDEPLAIALRSRHLRPVVGLTAETFGGRSDDALADLLAARPDAAGRVADLAAPLAVHVRRWQLGRDDEPPPLGVAARPTPAGLLRSAAAGVVTAGPASTGADVAVAVGSEPAPPAAWRVVRPEPDPDRFAWALLDAAAAGDGPVFCGDAFDPTAGLLTPAGRPTRRFLPFRTVAAAVGGGQFLGSVVVPKNLRGERPAVLAFETPRGPILAVRGDGGGDSVLRLGGAPVGRRADGKRVPIAADADGRGRLAWSPAPLLIAGAHGDLLRFRLGVTLGGGGALQSSPAPQPLTVRLVNPFAGAVTATVEPTFPVGWRATPEVAAVSLPPGGVGGAAFEVRLPSHVSLGLHEVPLEVRLTGGPGGLLTVPRVVRVRSQGVRLDVTDRRLPGGGWEVTQTLTHALPDGEEPAFRCDLLVPGAPRISRPTGPLGAGSHTLVHRLPDAAAAGETVWLRVGEVGGDRVLNRRWPLGSPPPPGE